MNVEYHSLSNLDVAIAAGLILVNATISLLFKLGLERRLLLAATRTVVQLVLVGWVLKWVFAEQNMWVVGAMMATMTLVAGFAVVRRLSRTYAGIHINSCLAMTASSWVVTIIALQSVVGSQVWMSHPAQYAIPFLGMILGNTFNGISLGLDRFCDQLVTHRERVELSLTMGATRWEAARQPIQEAIRVGMMPIINSMMIVGIVSLPGMMTGQLLSGVVPLDAIRYQIVIMFFIAAGTALGTMFAVLLTYRRLFNSRHQFLSSQLSARA